MSPVRQLWLAMRAQRGLLVAAAILGFIAAASSVALLGTAGWLISYAAQMPPVLALAVAAVMVRAFALSRSVFRYLERIVGHDAAFRGLTGLRVRVYERLEALAPVGLTRFSRGDLLARLVADVDAALDLPLRVVLPWAQAALVSLATVAFLAWLAPSSSVLAAVALLLGLTAIPWLVSRIAASAEARLAPARGSLSAAVVSTLEGNADLLAFGATGAALSDISRRDEHLTSIARREAAGLGIGTGLGVLVQGIAVVGCLALAIPAVTDGRLTPVWLAVVALLPLAAYDIVATLPSSAVAYQRVRSSAARIADVLDQPLPVQDPEHPMPLSSRETGSLTIECSDLYARWSLDGTSDALRGVHLRVGEGERIAIVGPSGAGKSTLAAVLLKFLKYDGCVTLGGCSLADMTGDEVRRDMGMLGQDSHIFDTTVRDNLRLGRADASDSDMRAALERVHLLDWLDALPRGLETELGPRGSVMSGGERQRLALARLLLANRPILVLDEPTEHLDLETADALTDDLLDLTHGRTTVLITHRLRGLQQVDRIVVLIQGQVRAEGTHAELVAQGGWYAERWAREQEQGDITAMADRIPAGTALVR